LVHLHAARGDLQRAFLFDPNSYFARKNPVALVRAFRLAFSAGIAMFLLLRIYGTLSDGVDRARLCHEIGAGRRIVVMEGTPDRIESLSVEASFDCLVSLHRVEAFGRNIAEPIWLQIPVLAAEYSGPEDFLEPGEALAFGLQKIEPGKYPLKKASRGQSPPSPTWQNRMQQVRNPLCRSAAGTNAL
jgi:hypothetical protein